MTEPDRTVNERNLTAEDIELILKWRIMLAHLKGIGWLADGEDDRGGG